MTNPLAFNVDDLITGSEVSTKTIRAAFAVEKLLRLTRRAGGFDYISQTAAHYGFEPPKGRGEIRLILLEGLVNNINISEVIAAADGGQSVTGQIYGKGIGALDGHKDFDYQAKEHGVLMCVFCSP